MTIIGWATITATAAATHTPEYLLGYQKHKTLLTFNNRWAFQHGYDNGILDGKASAHDSSPVCGGYNSTSDVNECYHGYDLGFKKGCEIEGNKLPIDPSPEYGQCSDYK